LRFRRVATKQKTKQLQPLKVVQEKIAQLLTSAVERQLILKESIVSMLQQLK
jgi:hypothetical protein